MIKIVREHINEKFTEEGDPISDMGIGGYTFETLRPGAVFKVKDNLRSAIAVTKNKSGQFTSWRSGLKLFPENGLIVTSIVNLNKDYKGIHFFKVYITNDVEKNRNNIKSGGNVSFLDGTYSYMIVSKKMFDNRFEIVERGF